MRGGVIAAQSIVEMFQKGCFGKCAGAKYHRRCMHAFGCDFLFSWLMTLALAHCPLFLDALTAAANKRSAAFMEEVGAILTGVKPKWRIMMPRVSLPIIWEFAKLLIARVLHGAHGVAKRKSE